MKIAKLQVARYELCSVPISRIGTLLSCKLQDVNITKWQVGR